MGWRDRAEARFAALGRWIGHRPRRVLAASLLVVAGLAAPLGSLRIDTSSEAMLRPGDPARRAYDAFRDEFGRDEVLVVGVRVPDTLDDGFVDALAALEEDLRQSVPHLREVTSLLSARHTRGSAEGLVVGELLEDWLAQGRTLAELAPYVVGHPHLVNHYVSADGSLAAILIETRARVAPEGPDLAELDPSAAFEALAGPGVVPEEPPPRFLGEAETRQVLDSIRAAIERHPDLDVLLSGAPVVLDAFNRATMRDMVLCASACTAVIALVLFVFFGRLSGVLAPLVVVELSVAASLGIMAWTGAPFTLSTNGIVPFLIVVGVCNAVHVLSGFYARMEEGLPPVEAVAGALGHSGPAIVMASLTTAGGLLSFATTELASIADLGIYAAAGVVVGLALTLVQLPALLTVVSIRPTAATRRPSVAVDAALAGFARLSTERPWTILAVALGIGIVAAAFLPRLGFSHDPVGDLPEADVARLDLLEIDRKLGGSNTLEIVVRGHDEGALHDPQLLAAIDAAGSRLRAGAAGPPIERVFSVVEIVKEVNQALADGDTDAYRLPGDRATIAQEMLLFENSGSDDLRRIVDTELSRARVSVKTPYADGMETRALVERTGELLREALPEGTSFTLTGNNALVAEATTRALQGIASSYLLAFLVISVLMILLVGQVRLGLVAMIPNLLPILVVMGAMGMVGASLDMTTVVVGSIALGIVVDDTLHFLYNFRKYYERSGDVHQAIDRTFFSAGRAMFVTSVILCLGFGMDMLASLDNVARFGSTVCLIVALALLADFLVAPALLVAFGRHLLHRAPDPHAIRDAEPVPEAQPRPGTLG